MGQICGRQALKILKSFKGSLPQILLGPFLNTLCHLYLPMSLKNFKGSLSQILLGPFLNTLSHMQDS